MSNPEDARPSPQQTPAAAADARPASAYADGASPVGSIPVGSGPDVTAYLDAHARAPEDVDAAYRAATALLRSGRLDEAAALLRKIVFARPDHLRARANLGNCQLLLGDLANAEASFRAVLDAMPDNHNALYGLATILIRQGRPEAALEAAQRLVGLLPDNAPALTLLADACAGDPRPGTAIAAYRAALRLDPVYQPALLGLARALLRRQRLDEAKELAERAVGIGSGSTAAYAMLGDVLAAQDALGPARDAYEAALDRDPADPDVKVKLSTVARRAGDLKAALRHADDAWSERPDHRDAGNAVGAALAALGERTAARTVLTAVAAGQPAPDRIRDVIEALRAVALPATGEPAPVEPDPEAARETGAPAPAADDPTADDDGNAAQGSATKAPGDPPKQNPA
ncbi:tetratricopeptide repeat protein [Polymorphum gilvum]|uniref:TPR repeat n=1 Tax=Polymorphum gilvum (strain LMG 25793 / CGMCC 1.9160 / SL003B-26A1) TaxID=991905 RepID=F2J1Q6_POLGS|nr:tetratricopeptide repeat protein [Polymorphum gilvum]ADZ70857.1 TPR repeat [Polymorphum gilvum SL003B-26A1]